MIICRQVTCFQALPVGYSSCKTLMTHHVHTITEDLSSTLVYGHVQYRSLVSLEQSCRFTFYVRVPESYSVVSASSRYYIQGLVEVETVNTL